MNSREAVRQQSRGTGGGTAGGVPRDGGSSWENCLHSSPVPVAAELVAWDKLPNPTVGGSGL